MSRRRCLVFASALIALGVSDVGAARPASAAPPADESAPAVPLADVLPRLARHAEAFEQMKRRGSYTLTGHVDQLSADGKPTGVKEMVVRVTPSGDELPNTDVVRYAEDGVDRTAEARSRQRDRRPSRSSTRRRAFALRLPFLSSEQPRYAFSVAEQDSRRPSRARIAFAPRVSAEDAYAGSAWVDVDAGEVLSIGFSPTKNPSFVDHVDLTVVFGTRTALGLAPTTFTFDARGSFLFVRKRYRGTATIAEARFE